MDRSYPCAHRGVVPEEDEAIELRNPWNWLEAFGLLNGGSIGAMAVLQVKAEDGLSLVPLWNNLKETVLPFPDKGAILVVNLVWIPRGNDETLLGEISNEDTLAAQNQAVVFKRERGEVKLGVEA